MATPEGTHHVVSASFLDSGAPAYRRRDGSWSADLQEAYAAPDAAERDAMLAAAGREEKVICDPYSFPVVVRDGIIDPLTARETIRASGPTVPYRRPDRAA